MNAPDVDTLPRIEPKIPWAPLALVAIALLWIPLALSPERDAVRPNELPWIPGPSTSASVPGTEVVPSPTRPTTFSQLLTHRAVEWESRVRGLEDWARSESGASVRVAAARRPSTIAALLFLLVYFAVGRRVIGSAASLVATALLGISPPFLDAARSAHPMLLAATLALAGIGWMVRIEARHREVGFTRWSAFEATGVGLFFGAALALHPAMLPAPIAALVLWLSLGLRRGHASTLPELRPGASAAFAWIGGAGLALTTLAAFATLDGIAGGRVASIVTTTGIDGAAPAWIDVYRWMMSPVTGTDVLVGAAAVLVIGIFIAERWFGTHWRGAGLLPWIYLLLFVLIVAGIGFARPEPQVGATSATGPPIALPELPLPIPSLLVLGLGWLVLRGFSPGRVRRQEYTFLLVWLGVAIALFPIGVLWDAQMTGLGLSAALAPAGLMVFPMVVLVAGRAARAFWESERALLARIGILSFTCLPIVAALITSIRRVTAPPGYPVDPLGFEPHLPIALGVAVSLGAFSVLLNVRPDQRSLEARRDHGPRRDRRSHRGGRGRGRPRGRRPRPSR